MVLRAPEQTEQLSPQLAAAPVNLFDLTAACSELPALLPCCTMLCTARFEEHIPVPLK